MVNRIISVLISKVLPSFLLHFPMSDTLLYCKLVLYRLYTRELVDSPIASSQAAYRLV